MNYELIVIQFKKYFKISINFIEKNLDNLNSFIYYF